MTPAERRFAQRLESKLEDDYLCWYDVPVGPSNCHPDFIVLHPRRGLLILEVKDWKPDTIRSITKSDAAILTSKGLSKGLEYPIVVIPGAGLLPAPDLLNDEEVRLLYVAMTRATSQLSVTGASA